MSDPRESDLPPMSDAVLDAQQLADLFRDYRNCLGALEIVVKHGPGLVADGTPPTLDQAEQLLTARTVRGVQVRYAFDGAQWCDTLMPVPGGVRLVRVAHPHP